MDDDSSSSEESIETLFEEALDAIQILDVERLETLLTQADAKIIYFSQEQEDMLLHAVFEPITVEMDGIIAEKAKATMGETIRSRHLALYMRDMRLKILHLLLVQRGNCNVNSRLEFEGETNTPLHKAVECIDLPQSYDIIVVSIKMYVETLINAKANATLLNLNERTPRQLWQRKLRRIRSGHSEVVEVDHILEKNEIDQTQILPLAMASHPRLGASSSARHLDGHLIDTIRKEYIKTAYERKKDYIDRLIRGSGMNLSQLEKSRYYKRFLNGNYDFYRESMFNTQNTFGQDPIVPLRQYYLITQNRHVWELIHSLEPRLTDARIYANDSPEKIQKLAIDIVVQACVKIIDKRMQENQLVLPYQDPNDPTVISEIDSNLDKITLKMVRKNNNFNTPRSIFMQS